MEKDSTRNLCYTAFMTVLICICSWVSIPFIVPFTLQTFAVFFVLLLLGGKNGTTAICIYLIMGMIGLPVFSGMRGGVSHLFGPTGGYIIGFVFTGITYMLFERLMKKKLIFKLAVLGSSLISCYLVGTLWFVTVYSLQGNHVGFLSAISICVLPYIIPDCIKISLAVYLYSKIKKRIW